MSNDQIEILFSLMAFLVWLLSYTSRKPWPPCFEVIKRSKLTTIVNEENSKRIIFFRNTTITVVTRNRRENGRNSIKKDRERKFIDSWKQDPGFITTLNKMLWSATGASKPMDQKSNIYIYFCNSKFERAKTGWLWISIMCPSGTTIWHYVHKYIIVYSMIIFIKGARTHEHSHANLYAAV
jgi:hypothetical protein